MNEKVGAELLEFNLEWQHHRAAVEGRLCALHRLEHGCCYTGSRKTQSC